jgi:hypothetical protein
MAQPPLPSPRENAQQLLGVLLEQLESAQSLAGQADPDAFAAACQRLSQSLAQHQRGLAQFLGQPGASDADTQLLLQRLGTGLALLRDLSLRQGAAAQRALGTLFPQEQLNAYQRLGQKGGYGAAPRSGPGGALKA